MAKQDAAKVVSIIKYLAPCQRRAGTSCLGR